MPLAVLVILLGLAPNLLMSFWTYSLVAWFCDFSSQDQLLLFLPLLASLRKTHTMRLFNIITVVFLIFVASLAIMFPLVSFFIAIITGVIFLLQPIALYLPKYKISSILYHLIIFLHNTKIINYLYIYYDFFYKQDIVKFKVYNINFKFNHNML